MLTIQRFISKKWFVTLVFTGLLAGMILPFPPVLKANRAPMIQIDEAVGIVQDLLSGENKRINQALEKISETGDVSMVAVLVDALFYYRINRNRSAVRKIASVLKKLTGEDLGRRYFPWLEWLGKHQEIKPHPVYVGVKSGVLRSIDPRFLDFIHPGVAHLIRLEEIVWGGVKVEGIPSLDNPRVLPADQVDYLKEDDRVFGVSINGESRAYPLKILDWHEMSNDVVGGEPVVLSYCTLCGSGILFSRKVQDRILTFGTSGLLYRSNKLMFDKETKSLWSNLTGKAVVGPMAVKGIQLKRLPITLTTWGKWRKAFPDTTVLDIQTGFDRDYRRSPYDEYFKSDRLMFPVWKKRKDLPDKAWIYGVIVDSVPVAYELDYLTQHPILMDKVNGWRLVVLTDPEAETVEVYGSKEDDMTRFIDYLPEGIRDQNGTIWKRTWNGLIHPDGRIWKRLAGHHAYWFGWFAFYPQTLIRSQKAPVD